MQPKYYCVPNLSGNFHLSMVAAGGGVCVLGCAGRVHLVPAHRHERQPTLLIQRGGQSAHGLLVPLRGAPDGHHGPYIQIIHTHIHINLT